jgi:hypothetical protein
MRPTLTGTMGKFATEFIQQEKVEPKRKLATTRHQVCEPDEARNTVKRPRSASDAHESPHTLTTSPIVQMKSPRMEMDVATVEKRKYEVLGKAKEIDEVSTDRDSIMRNSTNGDSALGDNAEDEPQEHQLSRITCTVTHQLSRITCTVTQTVASAESNWKQYQCPHLTF